MSTMYTGNSCGRDERLSRPGDGISWCVLVIDSRCGDGWGKTARQLWWRRGSIPRCWRWIRNTTEDEMFDNGSGCYIHRDALSIGSRVLISELWHAMILDVWMSWWVMADASCVGGTTEIDREDTERCGAKWCFMSPRRCGDKSFYIGMNIWTIFLIVVSRISQTDGNTNRWQSTDA